MTDGVAEEEVYSNITVGGPLTVGDSEIVRRRRCGGTAGPIAKNISDEDAVATFLAMKARRIRPAISSTTRNHRQTGRLADAEGFEPTEAPVNEGVLRNGGRRVRSPYPMIPYHGPAAHRAGRRTSRTSCRARKAPSRRSSDIEAAYTTAATEKRLSEVSRQLGPRPRVGASPASRPPDRLERGRARTALAFGGETGPNETSVRSSGSSCRLGAG